MSAQLSSLVRRPSPRAARPAGQGAGERRAQPGGPFHPAFARRPLAALIPLGILLLVVWSMMARQSPTTASVTASPIQSAAVLLVFLLTFGALSLNWIDRLTAVAAGTALLLLLGAALRFYPPSEALSYLWQRRNPLGLVAGIGLVTELLREGGVFAQLAHWAVIRAGRSVMMLTVCLCLLTFVLSLCLNNLATILVIVPLTIRAGRAMGVDPVPVVILEIIASNLGGAATMIGDLPNMIIANAAGIGFVEFIAHLAPICVLQLAAVLLVVAPMVVRQRTALQSVDLNAGLRQLGDEGDPQVRSRALGIFAAMLASFVVGSFVGLPLGIIALVFGHLAMFGGGVHWRRVVNGVAFDDVLFLACLFLMAGSVHASGILDGLSETFRHLWEQSPRQGSLAVAASGTVLAMFVSAGPATALMVHLLPAQLASGSYQLWWALSLGICAGSSATVTGATAGPVAAGLLERSGQPLGFNRFARVGLRAAALQLFMSGVYLWLR